MNGKNDPIIDVPCDINGKFAGAENIEDDVVFTHNIRKQVELLKQTGKKWEDLTQEEQDSCLLKPKE